MSRLSALILGMCLFVPVLAVAQDVPAVDLRGPAPKVGAKHRSEMRFEMKGADVTVKAAGNVLGMAKMDLLTVCEEEATIVETDGRTVTKYTTRIVKDETTANVEGAGGAETNEEIGELAGQVVVSEKLKSGWKHSLAEGEPTQKQQDALANQSPWDEEDQIPAGNQKIGATWNMDAVHFKKFFGANCTAVSGKAKSTFTGLTQLEGELCAVIETAGAFKGKLKVEGNEKTITMDIKVTEYRSLKSGVSIKAEGEGTMKTSGKEKIEEKEVDVFIQGKLKLEVTTQVLE